MGERVAVLLCGYGEVEEYDEFADFIIGFNGVGDERTRIQVGF